MTEKQFENKIKDFLKSLPKTWFFKYWAGPMSKAGIPDIICCCNGHFVGIEVKAPNGKPSTLQKRNIKAIQECGGVGYILYPKDFEAFKKDMRYLSRRCE
ncbi:VRR-NUC domain-containing protein [Clostridium tepidum]|uniref:VRR-NUC domain-containing protein n=1 Tax=Clostridium tepidum TaxID=1962263 RepID=UPI002149C2DB|nr:VRR-NUC domain-containing protein [Clostridium tepidum]MCR1933557.1 VRR-NUC domain-containing protein [Clostridium tepidum]